MDTFQLVGLSGEIHRVAQVAHFLTIGYNFESDGQTAQILLTVSQKSIFDICFR